MYLVNFDPGTGRVWGAGRGDASGLPQPRPAGTVAVESLPAGRASDYLYRNGRFVPAEGRDGACPRSWTSSWRGRAI